MFVYAATRTVISDQIGRISSILSLNSNILNIMGGENNALGHPKLVTKNPVPSDIQISQDIVKEVGLLSIEDVAKE